MKTAHPDRGITASNVAAEIARQHYRQADVASWLGISQPSVSAKMNGQTPFDIDELGVIAEHLGLPVETLVARPSHLVPTPFRGLAGNGDRRDVTRQEDDGCNITWLVAA